MSNGLDPDQDLCSVGPDLGPNCLQALSADDKKWTLARKELNQHHGFLRNQLIKIHLRSTNSIFVSRNPEASLSLQEI